MVELSIENVSSDVILAICWGCADIGGLIDQYPFLGKIKDSVCSDYRSGIRLYEVLAERLLLHELFGEGISLLHDERGCPYLSNGFNIGISHTKGCVAVIVAKRERVSVDVEYFNERVSRVSDRLLRLDENAVSTEEKLLHWCTKETVYKLFPEDDLGFSDIRLHPFNVPSHVDKASYNSGMLMAENLKRSCTVKVDYRISPDFITTYCILGH